MVAAQGSFPPDPPQSFVDILDRLGVGFYRSDKASRIRFINGAGAAIYGSTPEEMTAGLHTYDFDAAGFERNALLDQVLKEGFIDSYISPGMRRDGTLIYTTSTVRSIHDEAGNVVGFEGVFRDSTEEVKRVREQVELVEEVKATNERLLRLSALQDQLLSSLAHDLVTPPVVMQGFTELLLKGRYGPIAPAQEKPMRTIHRNVNLLSALVGELLEFTRFLKVIHAAEKGTSLLGDGWRRVTSEMVEEGRAEEGSFVIPEDLDNPRLNVPDEILGRLLENLARNALDLLAPGSFVSSDVRSAPGRHALHVTLEKLREDHPPVDRILDRFFPDSAELCNPESAPEGLGPAAARYAANLLGGDLDCEATGDSGLTFRLRLS